jgi:hypothetical protein
MNDKKPIFQVPQIGKQQAQQRIQTIMYENLDWIRIVKTSGKDFIYFTDENKDAEILKIDGLLVKKLALCIEPQTQIMYILKKGKQENNPSVTQDLILANIDPNKVPIVQITWGKSKKYEEAEKVIGITLCMDM